jgi:MOSC domain-containing protein YiiM
MGDMSTAQHVTSEQLDAGLADIMASPRDVGTVEMIVRRPEVDGREVLDACELVVGEGMVGDNYLTRPNPKNPGGEAHPEAQINLMNSRAIDLVAAGDRSRWALAGDQFFVDLDLSLDNLPVGTRLAMGDAVVEVAAKPHNGCAKFAERFGQDAARWVNRDKPQRRRGLNAMVVEPGTVRSGDSITKL